MEEVAELRAELVRLGDLAELRKAAADAALVDSARLDYIAGVAFFNLTYIGVSFNLDSDDGNLRAALDAAIAVRQEEGAQ